MSATGDASSNNIDPTTGRCALHPGIRLLLNRNDDGEWRTVLKACPLCVLRLPPTAVASAVAAEAAAARDHPNDIEHDLITTTDDLDEKIALKKQQMKHSKKKKKKKKHRSESNPSPRSRPRSPSPQSPYKPRRAMANDDGYDDHDDDDYDGTNNYHSINDPDPALSRKLFHSSTPPSSTPSLQPRPTTTNSRAGESMDRINHSSIRQNIEMDKKNDGGLMQQLGGGNNNTPPPNDYIHSNNNFVEEGRQHQRLQYNDDEQGSIGSHYSSSSSRRLDRHQSEVSSQSSHYSSSAPTSHRQSEVTSDGSYYSSAHSHARRKEDVSDDEESYYSSEEESHEGNITESDTGSHVSFREEQSYGAPNRTEERNNSYPNSEREQSYYGVQSTSQSYSQHAYQQQQQYHQNQYSHQGYEQNEWTSQRYHQQAGGGGTSQQQHQQWSSPQQQQHQSFHRSAPSSSQNNVRPDPEDFHPNRPPQLTAAERMMRHHQYNASPSPSMPQNAHHHQTQHPQMQTHEDYESDHSSDDGNDDDNGQEVLEPEDVSIISMNSSASRNLKRANEQKRREVDAQKHENGSQMDGDDDYDRPIKTCECDEKGRCVRHPQYQLRKKKVFKGWVTLLSNCPECCLDEMKRVKKKYKDRVSSSGEVGSIQSKSSSGKKKKKRKSKKKELPPITQLNVSNSRGSGVDDSSSGTASTFTIASSSNTSGRWQNYLTSNTSVASAPTTTARVTRLPYNDQVNGSGWYTGQVSMAGIPHGWGMMNYANGHTIEGEWRNGVSLAKAREAPPVLGRGGGSHFPGPSHYHQPSHQFHSSHREQPQRDNFSDLPLSHRQRTQLEPLREDPGRNEFHSRCRIVQNMPFRDDRGFVIGAYTGEVDEYNVPNGIGKMRYNDGFISEGRWIDGELDDGYNVTDDEDGDDDASYRSSSAMSAPGFTGHRYDGYHQANNNTSSYPGQNLASKLSHLEQKISAMDLNNRASQR